MISDAVKGITREEIEQRKTEMRALAQQTGGVYYGKDTSDGTTNTTQQGGAL